MGTRVAVVGAGSGAFGRSIVKHVAAVSRCAMTVWTSC